MTAEYEFSPQRAFDFEARRQTVEFVETVIVNEGVICDVYSFPSDLNKDLGIIKIKPGYSTPLQRILTGERTIEGFLYGKGELKVVREDGKEEVFLMGDETPSMFQVEVNVGDLMQWHAAEDSELVAYEVCYPPYTDGRYENL